MREQKGFRKPFVLSGQIAAMVILSKLTITSRCEAKPGLELLLDLLEGGLLAVLHRIRHEMPDDSKDTQIVPFQ